MGVIYLRTNTINGMQYVGQAKDFAKREKAWKNLKFRYANQLLTEDRGKYCLENWTVKILEECEDSRMNELERFWIAQLNTIYPNGYNSTDGGIIGFRMSEETKKKMSFAQKGRILTEEHKRKLSDVKKGTHHTEEWKKMMSRKMNGENNGFYGKHHTEETRQKISKALKGKPSRLKGKKMTEERRQKNIEASKKRCKTIYQYTLDGELVRIWESIRECGRNGFNRSCITKCCLGIQKEHKGYKWSYFPL